MKIFLLAGIFNLIFSSRGEDECTYALELLALQDGSGSFASHIDAWAAQAETLISRLGTEFGEYKLGLSSFTDKPIPRSGYGKYGNWGQFKQDYCYASHVPLSHSSEMLIDGLAELKAMIGSGFDASEAQAEAMLYAALDSSVGWSDPGVTHSSSGRPIVRIVMLITDEKSHEAGNAVTNINKYNAPRVYKNGYDQPSTGGFGAHDFVEKTSLLNDQLGDGDASLYTEMADLFAKSDAFEAGASQLPLTTTDSTRLQELIELFGPYPFPALTHAQHPGDASVPDCTQTEYPTLNQMVEALQRQNIFPIFLTSTSKAYSFYQWYQENLFGSMGLDSIVAMFNSDTLFDDMISSINSLVAKKCLATTVAPTTIVTTMEASTMEPSTMEPSTVEPSTMEPSTVEPSTMEPSTTEPSTMEPSTTEPSTMEPSTVEPSTMEPSTTEPSTMKSLISDSQTMSALSTAGATTGPTETLAPPVIIPPPVTDHGVESSPEVLATTPGAIQESSVDDVTSREVTTSLLEDKSTSPPHEVTESEAEEDDTTDPDETSTEEELQPPIIPPVVEGSSTGTIAGATAGAAAGLAAVGGLLYKTVGVGMFGGNTVGMEGVEQMEVPESPIEREAMEEVTMDMFH